MGTQRALIATTITAALAATAITAAVITRVVRRDTDIIMDSLGALHRRMIMPAPSEDSTQ